MSRTLKTVGAACAVGGGLLHAIKGAVLIGGGPDLSLVPAMITLFGAGLFVFALLLPRRGRATKPVAAALAALAAVAGVVSLIYQVGGTAPEEPSAPAGVKIAYAAGTFGILVTLLMLGVTTARERALPGAWRHVPLVIAVIWFPLEALTAVLPDGWGLLLAGLSWIPIGYCIYLLGEPGPKRTSEQSAPSTLALSS